LSCALIHQPSVLFLDEPTTGVDAVSRKEFWEMLGGLKAKGITILVSTPYMDEASRCDRVALMQTGRLMQVNTPLAITQQFGNPIWAVKSADMLALLQMLKALPEVEDAYPFGEYHHVVLHKGASLPVLPTTITSVEITADIEDCFMALMRHHARDEASLKNINS
jgi:ABC-2 type transport system ATP-binding protein